MLLEYLVLGDNESTLAGQRRRNWVWYRKIAAGEALTQALTDRDGVAHAFSLPPGAAASVPRPHTASVPRPHTAGGAAKAAANALSLARSQRSAETDMEIDAALARWQRQALRHGQQMSEWGIALGERIMDMAPHGASDGRPREGMF